MTYHNVSGSSRLFGLTSAWSRRYVRTYHRESENFKKPIFLYLSTRLMLDLLTLNEWTYQHYFMDFPSLILVLSSLAIWTYRRLSFGLITAISI